MQINIIYGASVDAAPAGFKTAVQAAVDFFEAAITTDVTINIQFDWNEVAGSSLEPGVLAASAPSYFVEDYYKVLYMAGSTTTSVSARTALWGLRPQGPPEPDNRYLMVTALEKAFGGYFHVTSIIDGYIGLNGSAPLTFDPNNRAVTGAYDAIGILAHEISEVLGRFVNEGAAPGGIKQPDTVLDLFRYSAPGAPIYGPGDASFSIDGQTMLAPFNNSANGGDGGDWDASMVGDAQAAFLPPGVALQITAIDLRVLELLGWQISPIAPLASGVATTPLQYTTSASSAQGAVLTFDGPYAIGLQSLGYQAGPGFVNAATVIANGQRAISDVAGVYALAGGNWDNHPIFQNTSTGVLKVDATLPSGYATGINYGPDVVNAGLIQVTSALSNATGVLAVNLNNQAGGVLKVRADNGLAVGQDLYYISQGGTFANAGSVEVSGRAATGVIGGLTYDNSGTLKVTATAGATTAIYTYYGTTLANSGLISADNAFVVDTTPRGGLPQNVTITNSGTIEGAIRFWNAHNEVHNTGTIAGAILFGDGSAVYDGGGGAQTGGIYLGVGTNSVSLGANGGQVFGGGGADTVVGASGDDFYAFYRGSANYNGAGGFNTVSFAGAATSATVDLSVGAAQVAGTLTLANVQRVIGTRYDDTLTAGALSTTLVGGGGHDTLVGGAGADTLVASTGGASATGGGGADTFVYAAGDHQLVVTDFGAGGVHDALEIHGYAGAQSVAQQGADTLITLSGSDSILLKNVAADALSGGDFVYSLGAYALTLPATPAFDGATVDFTSDLTILASEHLEFQGVAALFNNVAAGSPDIDHRLHTLDIFGAVSGTVSSGDISGLVSDQTSSWITTQSFTIESGASFSVANTGAGDARGMGADGYPPMVNKGAFSVSAAAGDAYGIDTAGDQSILNAGSGTWTVHSAGGAAFGAMLQNQAHFRNAGALTVTGVDDSYGVRSDRFEFSSIDNSGTLTVAASGVGAVAYGIDVSGANLATPSTITNSGTITADIAIQSRNFISSAPWLTITNSGHINGEIRLGDSYDSISNTGAIQGAIHFGDGDNTYNGVGGTQSGGIYLGVGRSTVSLGDDGEQVFVIGLGDHVIGGAGDDMIEVARGDNVIAGDLGFDTVSFRSSGRGVTANLATGSVDGAGHTTLSGIERLVGSDFDDTLTAAASGSTLIGAGGRDVLAGGAGGDVLVGSSGGAQVTGGGGADDFVFDVGGHQMVVTDFGQGGVHDTLDIYGYAAAQSVVQQGADTLITLSGTDSVLLLNTSLASVSGDVVYHQAAYAAPNLPGAPDHYWTSTDPVFLNFEQRIFAGETVNVISHTGVLTPNLNFAFEGHPNNVSLLQADGGRGRPFDNFGTLNISSPNDRLVGFQLYGDFTALQNHAGAVINVEDLAGSALAINFGARAGTLENSGVVDVTASGDACAVSGARGLSVINAATGVISVTSTGAVATGLGGIDAGSSVTNDGLITVVGKTAAIGFDSRPSWPRDGFAQADFTNNGQMVVSTTGVDGLSIGLLVSRSYNLQSVSTITNTGTITADVAILNVETEDLDGFCPLLVTNSGTINGVVDLGASDSQLINTGVIHGDIWHDEVLRELSGAELFGVYPPAITNSGLIDGDLHFGDGRMTFSGALGTVQGDIFLGAGVQTVVLGQDGERLFAAATGGVYSITGGAGVDTLVVSGAAASYQVAAAPLGGGWTISGAGLTATLLGIERVQFADQTLWFGATLPGGSASAPETLDLRAGHSSTIDYGFGPMTVVAGGDLTSAIGGSASDTLFGNSGVNILDGGGGADSLHGGAGDDTYHVDTQGDLTFEEANEGADTVLASSGYYLWPNTENLTLVTGAGSIFGVGNELANVLTGNEGDNLLIGWDGDDVLNGGAGPDSLFGVNGDDVLNGGGGVDYLVGGFGKDTLDGGDQADALYGEDGDDVLIGGATFDTDIMVAGDGSDTLHGDSGLGDYDLMDGGAGDDTYYVDTPADLTFEAANGGIDTVIADIVGAGYYLYANVDNLVLQGATPYGVGNELNNVLTGSGAGNWLLGGAGNDTLNGKGGGDVLFGEAGADTFVFELGTGGDVIGDFAVGIDKIRLNGVYSSFAEVQAHMVEIGGTTAITLSAGDFIVVNGVAMSAFTVGDFAFAPDSHGQALILGETEDAAAPVATELGLVGVAPTESL